MPLSADDIRRALDELSRELEREGQRAEMMVVGGAAIVLLFGTRQTTKDVDAYFVRPDAADRADAKPLLEHMHGTREEIWKAVESLIPKSQIDKASYAVDDLWETSHET